MGAITPTYDSRGNVTSAGSTTYGYSSENLLTSASGGVTLSYDPSNRLYETVGASTTRMAYDGDALIAEYNSSNVLQRRYVWGPGTDEPLVWYEGTGTSTRYFYHNDERGSVIALSNSSGNLTDINRYDEYGIPGSNAGRFQYTGQQWISELGMDYYRARIYSPTLGRFLQTDPIGYEGGMNLHAYVGNDPINFRDPSGLTAEGDPPKPPNCTGDLCGYRPCIGSRLCTSDDPYFGISFGFFGGGGGTIRIPGSVSGDDNTVVVTAAHWIPLADYYFFVFNRQWHPFEDTINEAMEEVHEAARRLTCTALSYLPEGGRIRLGVDAGAAQDRGLLGGGGFSLHRDGSFNWDHYYATARGAGFIAGGGLSIDTNAHQPGWTSSDDYSGAIGYEWAGANATYSPGGGVSGGGGISAGPRFGFLLTHASTSTYTRRLSGPICH